MPLKRSEGASAGLLGPGPPSPLPRVPASSPDRKSAVCLLGCPEPGNPVRRVRASVSSPVGEPELPGPQPPLLCGVPPPVSGVWVEMPLKRSEGASAGLLGPGPPSPLPRVPASSPDRKSAVCLLGCPEPGNPVRRVRASVSSPVGEPELPGPQPPLCRGQATLPTPGCRPRPVSGVVVRVPLRSAGSLCGVPPPVSGVWVEMPLKRSEGASAGLLGPGPPSPLPRVPASSPDRKSAVCLLGCPELAPCPFDKAAVWRSLA
ncbi:tetra-peptide repeat homeobox protein 1-like [Melanerpes formicivorus]|uniref:tetra-peptide repeat homeobox protein 1-like n=1 Tax=Melanerpes formicivorus TaxID=211600 RepID=UPI00358F4703